MGRRDSGLAVVTAPEATFGSTRSTLSTLPEGRWGARFAAVDLPRSR